MRESRGELRPAIVDHECAERPCKSQGDGHEEALEGQWVALEYYCGNEVPVDGLVGELEEDQRCRKRDPEDQRQNGELASWDGGCILRNGRLVHNFRVIEPEFGVVRGAIESQWNFLCCSWADATPFITVAVWRRRRLSILLSHGTKSWELLP